MELQSRLVTRNADVDAVVGRDRKRAGSVGAGAGNCRVIVADGDAALGYLASFDCLAIDWIGNLFWVRPSKEQLAGQAASRSDQVNLEGRDCGSGA